MSQLRTPLNAIIGMTGLLLESQLTDTQREWLELLEISGNTLLTLVGTHRSTTLAKCTEFMAESFAHISNSSSVFTTTQRISSTW